MAGPLKDNSLLPLPANGASPLAQAVELCAAGLNIHVPSRADNACRGDDIIPTLY